MITHLIGRDMSVSADENIALFAEVYTPIAAHAEAKGVRLAFENWPRNGTMLAITPELWDAMFTAVPSPALGLCYDPSHFYWLGIDYIQPIWDFRDRIYHAHAKDTEILESGRNLFGIYGRQLEAHNAGRVVAIPTAGLRPCGLGSLCRYALSGRLQRGVEPGT